MRKERRMEIRYLADQVRYLRMPTDELRQTFLLENLFQPEWLPLIYTDADRAIVGSAVPGKQSLKLSGGKELASDYFAERREIGVINIGAAGTITVDGETFSLDHLDGLYIGRGSKEISFASGDEKSPAKFYLLTYPAHTTYPVKKIKMAEAVVSHLGSRRRPTSEASLNTSMRAGRKAGRNQHPESYERTVSHAKICSYRRNQSREPDELPCFSKGAGVWRKLDG